MNIVELSEKNLSDALALYKKNTLNFIHWTNEADFTDEQIGKMLLEYEHNGDFTYLFYDKGVILAMVTICKASAEIRNMCIDFKLVDEFFNDKFLEFVIKQFSAITRVFVWAVSTEFDVLDMLENYGFEYTGEQQYMCKESNVLKYRYLFKRKK